MTNPASQQPVLIPEDLQGLYRVVSAYVESGDYAPISPAFAKKLIERIARLEAALTECAEVIFGNVIADKRTADAYNNANRALSTPLGTPGRDKP